jgi:uncharacterized protein (TIGR02145 family)
VYKIVQIGNQVWFAENLNYGTYHSGATEQADDSKVEKYCYNDVEANCDTYGGIYYWTEMMGMSYDCIFDMSLSKCQEKITAKPQGICPAGWHIPDTTEFMILIRKAQADFPGYENAVLRDESYGDAQYPGLDKYGFAALGSGKSGGCGPGCTGFTLGLGEAEYMWTSTLKENKAYWLEFWGSRNDFSYIFTGTLSVDYGHSVRCIRD